MAPTATADRTQIVMTSSVLDDDDEDVQNANTPDELTRHRPVLSDFRSCRASFSVLVPD